MLNEFGRERQIWDKTVRRKYARGPGTRGCGSGERGRGPGARGLVDNNTRRCYILDPML